MGLINKWFIDLIPMLSLVNSVYRNYTTSTRYLHFWNFVYRKKKKKRKDKDTLIIAAIGLLTIIFEFYICINELKK